MPQLRKRARMAGPAPCAAPCLPVRTTLADAVAELLRTAKPARFLQVGGFDGVSFDPLRPFIASGHLEGLIVEPLPDPFAKLRAMYDDVPAIKLANCAVAEEDGERALWRFKPEAVQDGRLNESFAGISSFRMGAMLADDGSLGRLFSQGDRDMLRGLVEPVTVACRTLSGLIEEHALASPDILQIDTKGYDLAVLRSFDFARFRPKIVNYEHIHLSANERAQAEALLQGRGYVTYPQAADTLALRDDGALAAPPDRTGFDGLSGNVIFCAWTGANPLTPSRAEALLSIYRETCCPVILLTPHNIAAWQLDGHPFHPAYAALSETHKADYLRAYVMHHFGGGYTDLKRTTRSWLPLFERLRRMPHALGLGYPEISPHGVATCGGALDGEMRREFHQLIGNCAYIFRRRSAFTTAWMAATHRLLDVKLDALRAHPARHPMDQAGAVLPDGTASSYPLRWAELLGEIFHPLAYSFKDHLLQADIAPSFRDYR